jgi:hypothetical protein
MKLYLCRVCDSDGCYEEPQEVCDDFKYNGQAIWLFDEDCPNCENGGMIFQDAFGAACAIDECTFKMNYKEKI